MSDASRSFSLSVGEQRHEVVVVSLAGELALGNSSELVPTLERLSTSHSGIVLDLSRLEFVDSSGLNDLVTAARAIRGNGAAIALAHPRDNIARVFQVVHLADSVPIEKSVDDAVTRVDAEIEAMRTHRTDPEEEA